MGKRHMHHQTKVTLSVSLTINASKVNTTVICDDVRTILQREIAGEHSTVVPESIRVMMTKKQTTSEYKEP